MTLDKFIEMLGGHDWYYMYSDDHRYWTKGRDQAALINDALKRHPEWMPMYMHYFEFCTGKLSIAREVFVEQRDQIKQDIERHDRGISLH